jgi:CheY-like chemotaxis protein
MAVDDNKDAALLLSLLLETSGYETLIEHDPYRALERIRNEMPDVCLLDIGLPGMDGRELARQIRSIKGAQPLLIAITGYGQDDSRESAREAGFDHYLVKPVDTKEIVALLAEHSEALARRSV